MTFRRKPVERFPQAVHDHTNALFEKMLPNFGTPPPKQFIYVIQSEHGFKIGKSINPKSRFSALKTATLSSLSLVLSRHVKDMHRTEDVLHAYFKSQHIKGEWFQLSADDLKFIESVSEEEIQNLAYSLGVEVAIYPGECRTRRCS
jgi:hypothetical protein